jgi:hypothetical protein
VVPFHGVPTAASRATAATGSKGTVGRMGRGVPIRWERRSATLTDGRTISWTWQPAGRYPQIVTAHVDGVLVADRIETDGTITRHADVAAELPRSIGHPDATAHRPHV